MGEPASPPRQSAQAGCDALAARTWVVLVHYPVLNRVGQVVTTAVTNLDVHDIARAARTYGLPGYLLVTPVERQRHLVSRILAHWRGAHGEGAGRQRAEALSRVGVVADLAEGVARVRAIHDADPILVATAARSAPGTVSPRLLRREVECCQRPMMLLFGTGWGLADEVFGSVEFRLDPILGPTDYNHLSVRSAVSILLDRLFGRTPGGE